MVECDLPGAAMTTNYFLKVRINVLNDRVIATLPDNLWRRYMELYLSAKHVNNCGSFQSIDDLAFTLRRDPEELAKDIDALRVVGLVTDENTIARYAEEQAAIPDVERKANQRERDRSPNKPVTKRERPVTKPVTGRDQSSRGRGKSSRGIEVRGRSRSKRDAAAALAAMSKLDIPIGEPKRSQIANLDWVTPDYLTWINKQWQKKPNADVGLLVRMIEAHDKPRNNGYAKVSVEKLVDEFKRGGK